MLLVQPDDWDETAPATIVDETATMPEDWLVNEPKVIPDPEAEKPEEWDDEEDGDWVPDMVPNPACEAVSGCGTWDAPVISNPAYKVGFEDSFTGFEYKANILLNLRANGRLLLSRTPPTREFGLLERSLTPVTTWMNILRTLPLWQVSVSSCGP